MRSFNLPASLPASPSAEPREVPDAGPPPPFVPQAERAPSSRRTEVFALLGRLRASFARAEAVHQARLDAGWNGPERHLLALYACSVK